MATRGAGAGPGVAGAWRGPCHCAARPLRSPIGTLSARGLHGVQVLEQALNPHNFALYIGRILAPQLWRGDVLALDNLRVHQLTGLRE